MCLIILAKKYHKHYPFIFAANRDEFYERPSAKAGFWNDNSQMLAGKDLKEGGTWLGVTKKGKFAAITNYRDPSAFKSNALSRGGLVSRYISGKQKAGNYLEEISRETDKYNGFNLILGKGSDLFVFSNRGEKQKLKPGIYGLSNHLLNTPWPKVSRGKRILKAALDKKGAELEEALFDLLADRHIPPDSKLPATGIGLEWERVLSSIFITSPDYGTRSSTILLIGKNNRVKFVEKVFDGNPEPWVISRFSFITEKEKSRV